MREKLPALVERECSDLMIFAEMLAARIEKSFEAEMTQDMPYKQRAIQLRFFHTSYGAQAGARQVPFEGIDDENGECGVRVWISGCLLLLQSFQKADRDDAT